jgi:hypothetical protein
LGKRGEKAVTLHENKVVLPNGATVELRIVRVPRPVKGSAHSLKYSLFYGRPGERIVGYDNERPKGDHKHIRGGETPYVFTTVEQLVADFLADVRAAMAEEEES